MKTLGSVLKRLKTTSSKRAQFVRKYKERTLIEKIIFIIAHADQTSKVVFSIYTDSTKTRQDKMSHDVLSPSDFIL